MFLFNVQHIRRNFDSCQSQHSALCNLKETCLSRLHPSAKPSHLSHLLSTRPSPLCRLHLVWSLVSSYSLTINHSPFVEVAATGMRRMQFLKYDYSTLYNPCFSLQKALKNKPSTCFEQFEHAGGVQRGGRMWDNRVNPRCWRDSLCKTSLDCTSVEQSQCSQSAEKGRRGKSAYMKKACAKKLKIENWCKTSPSVGSWPLPESCSAPLMESFITYEYDSVTK